MSLDAEIGNQYSDGLAHELLNCILEGPQHTSTQKVTLAFLLPVVRSSLFFAQHLCSLPPDPFPTSCLVPFSLSGFIHALCRDDHVVRY